MPAGDNSSAGQPDPGLLRRTRPKSPGNGPAAHCATSILMLTDGLPGGIRASLKRLHADASADDDKHECTDIKVVLFFYWRRNSPESTPSCRSGCRQADVSSGAIPGVALVMDAMQASVYTESRYRNCAPQQAENDTNPSFRASTDWADNDRPSHVQQARRAMAPILQGETDFL